MMNSFLHILPKQQIYISFHRHSTSFTEQQNYFYKCVVSLESTNFVNVLLDVLLHYFYKCVVSLESTNFVNVLLDVLLHYFYKCVVSLESTNFVNVLLDVNENAAS